MRNGAAVSHLDPSLVYNNDALGPIEMAMAKVFLPLETEDVGHAPGGGRGPGRVW